MNAANGLSLRAPRRPRCESHAGLGAVMSQDYATGEAVDRGVRLGRETPTLCSVPGLRGGLPGAESRSETD